MSVKIYHKESKLHLWFDIEDVTEGNLIAAFNLEQEPRYLICRTGHYSLEAVPLKDAMTKLVDGEEYLLAVSKGNKMDEVDIIENISH